MDGRVQGKSNSRDGHVGPVRGLSPAKDRPNRRHFDCYGLIGVKLNSVKGVELDICIYTGLRYSLAFRQGMVNRQTHRQIL